MMESSKAYIPAAGHHWSLPLYDPFVKLLGGDAARRVLLDQAALQPGQCILDVGCGTGSLAVLIKCLHPQVEVVGLDPDPKALKRAQYKAGKSALAIQFDQGFASELPYPEGAFDRVFSTLMFHHLERDEKTGMLQEVRRVLRPGGFLNLLDFGGPEEGAYSFWARLFHSSHRLKDNAEHQILALLRQAGFASAKKVNQGAMLFGRLRINYYQASKLAPQEAV